jgi:hypothetical protein
MADIYSLIARASGKNKKDDPNSPYKYLLSKGDLNQMIAQENFLTKRGFDVGSRDVYPALKTQEDYDRAVKLIFECRVDGWWRFEEDLIRLGVCTQEEFNKVLGRVPKNP